MAETSGDGHKRNSGGEFSRDMRFITADGRDGTRSRPGGTGGGQRTCPWANQATIVRRLLGLEDVLSMKVAGGLEEQGVQHRRDDQRDERGEQRLEITPLKPSRSGSSRSRPR
jgi:glutathionyl-hydroquinone reductase